MRKIRGLWETSNLVNRTNIMLKNVGFIVFIIFKGMNIDGKELWLPLASMVSICALIVWIPDQPDDCVTR